MLNRILSGMLLCMPFILFSCVKEQIPGTPQQQITKKQIAEIPLNNSSLKLRVYSEYDSLFVGYNPLYFSVIEGTPEKAITNAAVTISPVMDMISMKHSCPVDQPMYVSDEKTYKGAAVFTMPTQDQMGWVINVSVVIDGAKYENTIPIIVKSTGSSIKLVSSIKDQNNVFHYITLVHPQKPEQKTGINDLEVAVYKRVDMMNFPAVEGMNLSFVPTMPSMGHSSPNNVNPTGIGKGHYLGKVNFSMTGDWRLTFTMSGNGSTFADNAILDVLF